MEQALFDRVRDILTLEFEITPERITAETKLSGPSLGADSLDVIEAIMEVEGRLGVEIPDDFVDKTFGELVAHIERQLAGRAPQLSD